MADNGFYLCYGKYYSILEYVRKRGFGEAAKKSEHDQLIDLLCETRSMLGYDRVEGKFSEESIEYDVVRWRKPRRNPTHVFEIQLKEICIKR